MRGVISYIVVLHPNGRTYSIGIKYVRDTLGGREIVRRLMIQKSRKHKKPLHSTLCMSVVNRTTCELGKECPSIHINPAGFNNMRTWDRPIRIPQRNSPTCYDTSSDSDGFSPSSGSRSEVNSGLENMRTWDRPISTPQRNSPTCYDTSSDSDGLSPSSSDDCLPRLIKNDTSKSSNVLQPNYTVHRPYDWCTMTFIEPKSDSSNQKTYRPSTQTEYLRRTQVTYFHQALNPFLFCHQCTCGLNSWPTWNLCNTDDSTTDRIADEKPSDRLDDGKPNRDSPNWADYSSEIEMEFSSDDE